MSIAVGRTLHTASTKTPAQGGAQVKPSPLLYGHRGASAKLPENTLEAFRLALEQGANALEMDVRMTRDGVVVVTHDGDGRRVANVDSAVSETPFEELSGWDVGWGLRAEDGSRRHLDLGFRIPVLVEVLREFSHVPLNIDLKQRRPPIIHQVLRVIRECAPDAVERIRLTSLSRQTITAIVRSGYLGPIGMAQNDVLAFLSAPRRLLRRYEGRALQIPVRAGPLSLSARWVLRKARDVGVRVDYWTVNNPAVARELAERGADGVMSDDPGAVATAFFEGKASSS